MEKNIYLFHVLLLFIAKKHVLSKKLFQNFWYETNTFPYIFHICGMRKVKMGSTEIVMSSVRICAIFFSAGIAPRELKFD
jgi:hypothetical protein